MKLIVSHSIMNKYINYANSLAEVVCSLKSKAATPIDPSVLQKTGIIKDVGVAKVVNDTKAQEITFEINDKFLGEYLDIAHNFNETVILTVCPAAKLFEVRLKSLVGRYKK